jgi:putative restriction endonuclease
MERDEGVRTACFLALDVLRAQFGEDLPYAGCLDQGFPYRGERTAFLNRQKGIHRARAQRGRAALSIQTSYSSPYADEATPDGFVYAYRAGSPNQADNRALRAAHQLQTPLVYFVGIRPSVYEALYPCFITADDPATGFVQITPGAMLGPVDEREPVLSSDPIDRRYRLQEVKVRLHQARFRGRVLPAYRDQCAVCRLKELRLLDAAHIIGDADTGGVAAVSNGLSLCSIHHRAYDHDLVGISPEYQVHVARRLLDDEDGPMLELLKGFQGTSISVPARTELKPSRELLAVRFDRFKAAA